MKYVESGSSYNHSVGYTYDNINNLTALVETINGVTRTTSYGYDDDNRVTSVSTNGVSESYAYDSYGRVTTKVTKNGGTTVLTEYYTYKTSASGKPSSQVATMRSVSGGRDVTYTYEYDSNGNITSVSDGTQTTTYSYDSANQLIRENNQAADMTWGWIYDDAGNILRKNRYAYTTGTLGSVLGYTSYSYGDSAWGDLLTFWNGESFSYDTIGNLTSDGIWSYTWEHGRELASMSDGSTTWSFTYNADGLRTQRTNGSRTYSYVYNGSSLRYLTVDGHTMRFTYDASGNPLSVTYDGTEYYYVLNLQGDVVAILDGSGSTVVAYTYDAWGDIPSTTGSLSSTLGFYNPLRYRGYVYDNEYGLYYLQSRYYSAGLGRFINADVEASTGHGLLGANMFAYCANNPVNNTDGSGQDWWHWAAAVAIVVVAAVAVVATAGGVAGAALAVTAVANGVAVSSTATTVAAGVFVGSSIALASSAYGAAIESDSLEEFAQYGDEALIATAAGGGYGGVTAYSLPGHNCFVAGTLVQIGHGSVPIESVSVGTKVWAWDEATGEVALKKVVETYIDETDELVHVFVNGEKIVATPSHPFYSPVKGWTDAVHLRAGDILVVVNGEYVVVEQVQHEILENPVTVYNFQVEDYHTYYVSDIGILVHNTCRNPNGKKGGPAHQNTIHEISDNLENQGYTVTHEYRVNTPGGVKNTRYIDIYATDGTNTIAIQVGRSTNSGLPVSRERRALQDLVKAGIDAFFIAYN